MDARRLLIRVAILAAIAIPATARAADPLQWRAAYGRIGLLRYNDADLLADGALRVTRCWLARPDGNTYAADLTVRSDEKGVLRFDWGGLMINYARDRAAVSVEILNSSKTDTIVALCVQVAELKFPISPPQLGKDATMGTNIGEVTAIGADFGKGVICVCNEDVVRPLAVGFGPPSDGNTARTYPVLAWIGRHPAQAKRFPWIDRAIAPGGRDTWTISLRFGPEGTKVHPAATRGDPMWARFGTDGLGVNDLAEDLYKKFAEAYPFELNWPDRRPIGRIFLSQSARGWEKNPRGWFGDAKLDVTTDEGRADFRKRLMEYADRCIAIMKEMNAQGVIVWDLEGEQYPHATSYLGDPRSLPPEMDAVADEFLKKFTDANFRVGLTIRPQMPVRRAYDDQVRQLPASDPAANMSDKVAYAKERWGCTIFYLDSNRYWVGDPYFTGVPGAYSAGYNLPAEQKVTRAHPDILLIPEKQPPGTYAYSAPYVQLNYDKLPGTPAEVLRSYPKAFSVTVIADADMQANWDAVVAAVRRGDILFYRTWFHDKYGELVKKAYAEAALPPDANSK